MLNVKNTVTFSIVFSLLIFLCFSCDFSQKESLKKNNLHVDYYVRYLQKDKQVKAIISFNEEDSTKKIMPKKMEEVLFEDYALSGKKVGNQYQYQLTKEIPFLEDYGLTYRLNKEQSITQTITIPSLTNYSIKKGKVSKKVGTTLFFEDQPLQTNETLVLLLSDEANKTATIKIMNQSENTPITILPEHVSHLAAGKGTMYMVRKQTIQKQSVTTQLTGLTEYYSAVKQIEIIE